MQSLDQLPGLMPSLSCFVPLYLSDLVRKLFYPFCMRVPYHFWYRSAGSCKTHI